MTPDGQIAIPQGKADKQRAAYAPWHLFGATEGCAPVRSRACK